MSCHVKIVDGNESKIKKWNDKIKISIQKPEMSCGDSPCIYCVHCGASGFDREEYNYCASCGRKFVSCSRTSNVSSATQSQSGGNSSELSGSRGTISAHNGNVSSASKPRCLNNEETGKRRTVSFNDFRARKEKDRRSNFRPVPKKSKQEVKDVTINVGMMQFNEEKQELRPVWAKTLPLTVEKNSTCREILAKALAKRKAHDRRFAEVADQQEFQILLPDGSDALFLPGEKRDFFSLEAYKNDLGKPYGRITLYLCSVSDKELEETARIDARKLEDDVAESVRVSEHSSEQTSIEDYLSRTEGSADVREVIVDSVEIIGAISMPASTEASRFEGDNINVMTTQVTQPKAVHRDVRCPTCRVFFPSDVIEGHADLCAENKYVQAFIDIIDDEDEDIVPEDVLVGESSNQGELNVDTETQQEGIPTSSDILKDLTSNVGPVSRLNVRRGRLLEDYIGNRRKCPWHKPENVLKVTFVGEPAIDSGGPRREFLTG